MAELNGTADAAYLQPGVYTYSTGAEPYTFDPAYSKLEISGESKKITGGTINVTLDERIYTFAVEYILESGETFRGRWSGELPAYTQWLKGTMTGASYNDNPQAPGTFYVKFHDADWQYEMALVLVADESAKTLPAGTYKYSDIPAPGTISSASNVDTHFPPRGNHRFVPGSEVVVEKNGEEYTFKMNFNLDDGRTAEFTYTGGITGTPTFKDIPKPVVYKITNVDAYSQGNATLVFANAGNDKQLLQFDCYGSSNAVYFEPGEYVVGAQEGFRIDNGSYTFFSEDGVKTSLTSGTLKVSLTGDIYTFDFTGKLSDGKDIVMTCTGKLPKYGPVIEATMSKASYNDNPQAPGHFFVKMNDADWKYEMAIEFVADASAQVLPAGTYTYSELGITGTITSRSYVDTFNPSTQNKLKEGSQVTVLKTGDDYTIVMSLHFVDGRIANLTFTGKISGTPVFE